MLLASLIFFKLIPSLIFPNLIQPIAPAETPAPVPVTVPLITITAYSSTPEQTDDTPFITASGHFVEDGIVACNFLAFNTKIKLPELYGEKIFTVKDRMAKKNSHKIDIWFPSTEAAKNFGVQKTRVEIVES
jgi:3D (Asp-Asp-Asp) domain-containing protein